MYLTAETCPEPSQATKINVFTWIVNVFKLMSFFEKDHHGCLKGSDYTSDLF